MTRFLLHLDSTIFFVIMKTSEIQFAGRQQRSLEMAKRGPYDNIESAVARKGGGAIQSIDRAFAILEEVARHKDGINLADLSRRLDLHTSTVFHLLKTLLNLGYLRQSESGKRYRIGRGIFALAATCSDEFELADAAAAYLEELAHETGEAAHFAVWSGDQVLILARAQGHSPFQMNERAGMLRPVHCTAIGKALLAGLDPDQVDELFKNNPLPSFTANTITDPAELKHQLERIRRDGVAFDDSEYNEEARCIAAPVSDFRGRVVGAIGFSGPVWRVSLADLSAYAEATREFAARLSRELGYQALAPDPKSAAADA